MSTPESAEVTQYATQLGLPSGLELRRWESMQRDRARLLIEEGVDTLLPLPMDWPKPDGRPDTTVEEAVQKLQQGQLTRLYPGRHIHPWGSCTADHSGMHPGYEYQYQVDAMGTVIWYSDPSEWMEEYGWM